MGFAVTEDGTVHGDSSGVTLIRRMMRLFDRPILVAADGTPTKAFADFDVMALDALPVNDVVVVNFDVLDSPEVYRRLKKTDAWHHPKVVNFVWWNVSEFSDRTTRRMIGVSCALFPTVTNSHRTAEEILVEVRMAAAPALADKAWIEPVTLGIDVQKERLPRDPQEVPVVLYPAMYLFARKRPDLWVQIVGDVARRTPLRGVMRLDDAHLRSERTADLRLQQWLSVGPLVPRETLPRELARTDVFLATSEDESYGLAYLEALHAGVIGLFPNRPWARAILPTGYPYVYRNTAEAVDWLYTAVTKRDVVRAHIEDVPLWVESFHDRREFDVRFPQVIDAMAPVR